MRPIVMIPARLASTRLPNKPLADINGRPMILHVLDRAQQADLGPVVVAAAEEKIVQLVEAAGGQALLTRPEQPSGADRIFEALERFDPDGRYDVVVNVQGDIPTVPPADIRQALTPLDEPAVDIATLATLIKRVEERHNPNVVKIAAALSDERPIARALYFSRTPIPWTGADDGLPLFHHIGLYVYRRPALARFVSSPPTALETRERLEQLRALELGMRIDVALVDSVPLGVDTPADLARARAMLSRS